MSLLCSLPCFDLDLATLLDSLGPDPRVILSPVSHTGVTGLYFQRDLKQLTLIKEEALTKREKQRLTSSLAALKSYNHEDPAEEVRECGASKKS
ncbi:hypothetical protein STEG23_032308 [Scotinomys teguina]